MELSKAQSLALKYLSYRPRTIKELETYLMKKKADMDIIQEVINYLLNLSYLNDEKFCELWIKDRINLKPMGKTRIYYDLLQKGVKKEVIEICLEEHLPNELEYELALELAKNKSLKLESDDEFKKNKKLSDFMYRRGFSYSIINSVINEINPSY
ncbi:regulatory protein [Desulfonispora thiosulfatigenes DSM 11270]|uniref:Regulatory protein RecX n=1 Tax=Desulfonispora thiosulfatigenes DSM 11270 TaxID=656914 RepID=A0A1W1VSR6_DESTI|nr:regulatory protein RecX [Desulfonispora thiosulfatigenes]SMB96270.1 regulatory protein [Desulfonispora thiosulfatigenes DSM 11270]